MATDQLPSLSCSRWPACPRLRCPVPAPRLPVAGSTATAPKHWLRSIGCAASTALASYGCSLTGGRHPLVGLVISELQHSKHKSTGSLSHHTHAPSSSQCWDTAIICKAQPRPSHAPTFGSRVFKVARPEGHLAVQVPLGRCRLAACARHRRGARPSPQLFVHLRKRPLARPWGNSCALQANNTLIRSPPTHCQVWAGRGAKSAGQARRCA